jgi:hypothetical protein
LIQDSALEVVYGRATIVATPVRHDAQRTRRSTIYIAVLAFIGAGLVGAGLRLDWGFASYAGGAFFLFVAALGASQLVRGGAWEAACPSCGARLSSADHAGALADAKLLRCDRCRAYLRGTDSLEVVADDYLHSEPVFAAPLPRGATTLRWPPGCARCGAPATRSVRVHGQSVSPFGALIPGVTIIGETFEVEVPACDDHKQPVELIDDVDDGPSVLFASFPLYARFKAMNDPASTATPPTSAPAAPPTAEELARLPAIRRARIDRVGGRCPVHDQTLRVGPGYESTLELLPSHEAEAMEMALPFCLHVGESFSENPRSEPTTLVWCDACVAAARDFDG